MARKAVRKKAVRKKAVRKKKAARRKGAKRGQTSKLDDLKAHPANPRIISDEARAGLRHSLYVFGDLSGVVYNKATGHLICAHQRKAELKTLDLSEIKWQRQYKVELGEKGARFASAERDGWARLPGGARFRVREVNWPEEAFERAANIAANSPTIKGEFTPEAKLIIEELRTDLPALTTSLRLEDIRLIAPEIPNIGWDADDVDKARDGQEDVSQGGRGHDDVEDVVCPKCGHEFGIG